MQTAGSVRHFLLLSLTGFALLLLLANCTPPRPVADQALMTATPSPLPLPVISIPTPVAQVLEEPLATPEPEPLPDEPTLADANAVELPDASPSPPATLPGEPPTLSPALPGTAEGFELVGHTALNGSGWHAALALKDHCAYVGNRRSGSITIVDVSDPAVPTPIGAIPFGPQGQPIELRTLPERNLLVVADFGSQRLFTFDVADCTAPQPLSALDLPGAPHEFHLWTDGKQTLIYAAMFDQSDADLIVVDVTDPAAPTVITRWSAAEAGVEGLLHSLSVSPDGRRLYLAMWNGGVLVADVDLPEIQVLLDGEGNPRPAAFVAAHSVTLLQNSNPPTHLLVTTELWRCPFSGVFIVSIADPARPYLVSNLALPGSDCDNLPAEDGIFNAHNPLVVGNLVFLSWFAAGVQVLDVSDPLAPQRVAQFVPTGDANAPMSYIGSYPVQTWSYPVLRDGLLYITDIQSGLYILRYTGPGAGAITGLSEDRP